MDDNNVIQLFKDTPVEEQTDAVADFYDEYMSDFMSTAKALDEASTEEEFRGHKAAIEDMVRKWPRV